MPITCRNKRRFGKEFCLSQCEATPGGGFFEYLRVEEPGDLSPPEEQVVEVAILDMNHGWPNLGHDSLVHAVQDACCDLIPRLQGTGLRVRAVSYEVRRKHMIPDGPGGRSALYLGTGGPGHLDPHRNDGTSPGTQGIAEDPSWEPGLFRLFDRILASEETALLAVCHTFGVMCRWAGTARPVLRPPEKGGKSAGVMENVLTPEGAGHPWFSRLAQQLPDGRRFPVVDHRLYDLIPEPPGPPSGVVTIAHEARGLGGPPGEAVTMLEFARDPAGVPRVFAVNHHPEIVDRGHQLMILRGKRERGEVSSEWFEERVGVLTAIHLDDTRDRRLQMTSDYSLLGPLRYHLYRQVRRRAEALGRSLDLQEDEVLAQMRPAG